MHSFTLEKAKLAISNKTKGSNMHEQIPTDTNVIKDSKFSNGGEHWIHHGVDFTTQGATLTNNEATLSQRITDLDLKKGDVISLEVWAMTYGEHGSTVKIDETSFSYSFTTDSEIGTTFRFDVHIKEDLQQLTVAFTTKHKVLISHVYLIIPNTA